MRIPCEIVTFDDGKPPVIEISKDEWVQVFDKTHCISRWSSRVYGHNGILTMAVYCVSEEMNGSGLAEVEKVSIQEYLDGLKETD